jgi:hypothetical protein
LWSKIDLKKRFKGECKTLKPDELKLGRIVQEHLLNTLPFGWKC